MTEALKGRARPPAAVAAPAYAELLAMTNFSFLRGASHPHEMVARAKALGMAALGVCDRNSLAGVVRAHAAAEKAGLALRVGARLVLQEGLELACYPTDRAAYARLTQLLTRGARRAPKGECHLTVEDVAAHAQGQILILIPPDHPPKEHERPNAPHAPDSEGWPAAQALLARAPAREDVFLALIRRFDGRDDRRLHRNRSWAAAWGIETVVAGDARMHDPARRPLADVLACIREGVTIDEAGWRTLRNAEAHLKPPEEMARLFPQDAAALARTAAIAKRVRFSLKELAYQYPDEVIGPGETAHQTLERLTWAGAAARRPDGLPQDLRASLEHELALIAELKYAPYFLTVHDLVQFARSKGILCQGRGSAANSAVCYCLGVTAVDPARVDLLFERFISAERGEPPDIDVDFEHARREEVIQYVYNKYGRHRAGLAAAVVTYRAKGAVREVGKALGLCADVVEALAKTVWGWSTEGVRTEHVERELGLNVREPRLAMTLALSRALVGFPRHLSQHVGGFVITRDRLDAIVPIQNAAMAERTVVEWDKDDLETLGILKVDVLGLGMLSCIAGAFELLADHYDRPLALEQTPAEDPRVYDMICEADTLGVFQIESRAQMSMLPRLKPRCYYDLVIEVAIVRPGPIQGDMVHPYLRRRDGLEPVTYPSPELEAVLGKTLGVPLFQEQAMRIAIVAAGFTPSEADQLRRAMATFRKRGIIHEFGLRLVDGMVARGYDRDFAERCFRQIEGFGEYGFPESHAASFALLVYVSCWLKCHYPDVFLAAILNAQPMGFYAPAQLVRDARAHGVIVRAPDVNASAWDARLEADAAAPRENEPPPRLTAEGGGRFPVRLGLRQIKGLSEADAARVVGARAAGGPFVSVADLQRRARISAAAVARLAQADACRSLGLDRRAALWEAKALSAPPPPLFASAEAGWGAAPEPPAALPAMPLAEHVVHDYAALRLSLKAHPVAFFRDDLVRERAVRAADLAHLRKGARVDIAGLVLVRQRPGSAKGVIFATLEDETGVANVIVWPKIFARFRPVVMAARFLQVRGRLQREGLVIHVVADQLWDLSARLAALSDGDADVGDVTARADEVNKSIDDPRLAMAMKNAFAARRATAILPPSRDFH